MNVSNLVNNDYSLQYVIFGILIPSQILTKAIKGRRILKCFQVA